MKEDIDYVMVERPSSEFYSIKLLTGNWAGVIYTYGTVSIKEDKAKDVATLSFQFKIEECPEGIESDALMEDKSFKNYIGDILSSILEQNDYSIGKKLT